MLYTAYKLSQRGFRAEPQPKSNSVHFSFKIRYLVATILVIFLRINLPNFMQFKQYQGIILFSIRGWGGLSRPRNLRL